MDCGYTLKQIVSVAKVHPLYAKDVEYPPTPDEVRRIIDQEDNEEVDLKCIPLATKDQLYKTIERLTADPSDQNTFWHGCYLSTTGGGSGGAPMLFATDAAENRRQRNAAGILARTCGVIKPGDLVMSLHTSGGLYRALDLLTEVLECGGGSVLCAGGAVSMAEARNTARHFRVNTLTADASQILQFANFVASLPDEERAEIKIKKVIYTSEPLNRPQKAVILAALGQPKIYSLFGSAEAGPWAVANPYITGEPDGDTMEFLFDTRMMNIEILPTSIMDQLSLTGSESDIRPEAVPDGEVGIIVQTSLCRLRNPLLRYVTGDLGSLRPLSKQSFAGGVEIPAEDAKHLRVLCVYGRDRRFSFEWFGEYFEYQAVEKVLKTEGWNVIQWQVVLQTGESNEIELEVRLYRSNCENSNAVSEESISNALSKFFAIYQGFNDRLFKVTFVRGLDGFERSSTGAKVMRFVDRTTR
ncbi:hypothetical protein DRE_04405 [Drechslerella stenobrocha 248]|uniref:AMP-dependent synthetase/ligase domain-containing protein n=1 Tax=Drechslerella stenobrocha 248 TaxID=1043628 RepID=W7I1V6_9PEZI|nr:hypothetical protein DRE_04405 [Drechslerella stenobrocha 248]